MTITGQSTSNLKTANATQLQILFNFFKNIEQTLTDFPISQKNNPKKSSLITIKTKHPTAIGHIKSKAIRFQLVLYLNHTQILTHQMSALFAEMGGS